MSYLGKKPKICLQGPKLYKVHCKARLIIEHIENRELKGQTIEQKKCRH